MNCGVQVGTVAFEDTFPRGIVGSAAVLAGFVPSAITSVTNWSRRPPATLQHRLREIGSRAEVAEESGRPARA
jgi:hypothetical protein